MAEPENAASATNTDDQKRTKGRSRKFASRKGATQDVQGLIQQAELLYSLLRDAQGKTAELLKSLKRHRRQRRILQSTLQSLDELKTLGI